MSVAVGLLSVAHAHADSYANALTELPDATLVGLTDADEQRGREAAERHDTEFLSGDALLERVDGAIVCSPNATHEEWVSRAAEASVDVLCEKPLATSYEAAQRIVNVCDRNGVNAGLSMPHRFNPLAIDCREIYAEGGIGDLRFITGTNRGKMPGGWFVDPERSGGGTVIDHTVHILDLVRWITGQEVRSVYAEAGTHFHDIPVEDVNMLSMELEDGTPFTLDGSWSRPEGWERWGDATLELLGTDGVASIDSTEQSLRYVDDATDGANVDSIDWGTDRDAWLVEEFVEAVRDDRPPKTPIEDGATEMAVVDAAYESIERGESVTVEY